MTQEPETVPVLFTLEELWLLQSVVRHEIPQQESWSNPPASLALNDQLAEAILMCVEDEISEVALVLSRSDCLVLDATVPQNAKNAAGSPIGKSILVKSFMARRALAGGPVASADDPEMSREEIESRIAEWNTRRRRA